MKVFFILILSAYIIFLIAMICSVVLRILSIFLKKDNCDVCKIEVRKRNLVVLNNIKFCSYDCYDNYLKTLSRKEWYKFFGIEIKTRD